MQRARHESRSFWLLWFASGAAYFAGSMAKIALPVFAARETGSPLVVSAVVLGFTAPRLLLGLPLGVLVDRLDRRILLIVANGARLLALAALAAGAVLETWRIPLVVLTATVVGIAEIVDEPAFTALVPAFVDRQRLDGANRRLLAGEIAVDVLSQPAGGALVGIGLAVAVLTGGLGYFAGIVALVLIAGQFRAARVERVSLTREVVAGLDLVWRLPVLRAVTVMAGVINACWTAWLVAFVLHALAPGPMGLREWSYGLLMGADGIGGATGVLAVGFVLSRFGRRWAIGVNIVGNALMFLVSLFTVNVWLTGLAIAIGGVGAPLWGVVTRTLQQRVAPDHLLGRVSSAYRYIGFGANAIGTLAGGIAAQLWGSDIVFLGAGILTLLMLIPFQRAVKEGSL